MNVSGALVNRVKLAPVALAHEIVKYALTCGRGSRYGCGGVTGGARAGNTGEPTAMFPMLPMLPEAEWSGVDEREKEVMLWNDVGLASDTGVPGAEGTAGVHDRGDEEGKSDRDGEKDGFVTDDIGRGLETDEEAPRPSRLLSRGGKGNIPEAGAEGAGMGSTED